MTTYLAYLLFTSGQQADSLVIPFCKVIKQDSRAVAVQ